VKQRHSTKGRSMSGSGIIVFCLLAFLLSGCDPDKPAPYTPEYSSPHSLGRQAYILGVHPLHNPQRLEEFYGPIVEYMNRHIPEAVFRLEASRSYEEFDRILYGARFHFALPNPCQTINLLRHGYRVFGKMGGDAEFRGIILVRKDGGINEVTDLRGKTVSFPAPTALAATMMPLYHLHTLGPDIAKGFERLFSGSHGSPMMNVSLRKSTASATWPPPWEAFKQRHPKIAAQFTVRWETCSLINNGLVVRGGVPCKVTDRVAEFLFTLHDNPEDRSLLAALPLKRFEPALDKSYSPVTCFTKKDRKVVRE